ncbi:hypothetical protein AB0M36_02765 [Actinoplanes sp. NPDC051346]|uniref:hypothetical protein n=1 Tax=Actinoplanes sp. NPDC051346 TaxID=3155048 RepID=UPI003441071C
MGIPSEGSGIEVSIDGLRDLANQMKVESGKTLGDVHEQANGALSGGTPFGAASASGYVHAAKHRYDLTAQRAIATLNEYATQAVALANAALAIANKYGDSDAFAKAQVSDVQREIAAALAAERARQQNGTATTPGEAV